MITERPQDFEHWRRVARELLSRRVSPARVRWLVDDCSEAPAPDADSPAGSADSAPAAVSSISGVPPAPPAPARPRCARWIVPREFIELASLVACHRDPARWDLLYRELWRVTHGEPRLLGRRAEEVASRLAAMEREVRLDIRGMKAMTRFHRVQIDGEEHALAWRRPAHQVLNLVAAYFRRRFRSLRWTLMTPDGCANWDGATLRQGPGVVCRDAPASDAELIALWRTCWVAQRLSTSPSGGATCGPEREV